jgi:hypothetical protein
VTDQERANIDESLARPATSELALPAAVFGAAAAGNIRVSVAGSRSCRSRRCAIGKCGGPVVLRRCAVTVPRNGKGEPQPKLLIRPSRHRVPDYRATASTTQDISSASEARSISPPFSFLERSEHDLIPLPPCPSAARHKSPLLPRISKLLEKPVNVGLRCPFF